MFIVPNIAWIAKAAKLWIPVNLSRQMAASFFKRNICNFEILHAILSKSFQGFQSDGLHESKLIWDKSWMGMSMNKFSRHRGKAALLHWLWVSGVPSWPAQHTSLWSCYICIHLTLGLQMHWDVPISQFRTGFFQKVCSNENALFCAWFNNLTENIYRTNYNWGIFQWMVNIN